MSHAIAVSVLIVCDTGLGSRKESLQRQCADPHGSGALVLVKLGAESGVSLPRLCFHLGDETRNGECELKSAVEKGWLVETTDSSICGPCNA